MTAPAQAIAATDVVPDRIVELRQYTLRPGRRDSLIDLFEREFVETQEACGMRVIGQFRDLDDADRFVWLRGFRDMPARAHALAAFYGGPVWKAHREAANATMLDSDNVLLLRPARADCGFAVDTRERAAIGATPAPSGLLTATIWYLHTAADARFVDWFERRIAPLWRTAGATLLARLASEHGANTFPALPVREGENAFVCVCAFADAHAHSAHVARLAQMPAWTALSAQLRERLAAEPEVLRLAPTPRSRLR